MSLKAGTSSHALLVAIGLTHSYYNKKLCSDFEVAPTSDTARLMQNHRCVLKPKSNGAEIYVETDDASKPKIPFQQNATLSFELRLKNPEFMLFTELMRTDGSSLTHPSTEVSGAQISYAEEMADKFFARIDIQRDFNLIEGKDVAIAFSAKQVYWVYYLVTDQAGPTADFSVVGQDSQATTWKRLDGTDRISQHLMSQYQANIKVLRFASEQAIRLRESGLKQIQLLFGGNKIIDSLPNPSRRNYFQTEMEAGEGSVDAIFQVVKFLTNTTTLNKV